MRRWRGVFSRIATRRRRRPCRPAMRTPERIAGAGARAWRGDERADREPRRRNECMVMRSASSSAHSSCWRPRRSRPRSPAAFAGWLLTWVVHSMRSVDRHGARARRRRVAATGPRCGTAASEACAAARRRRAAGTRDRSGAASRRSSARFGRARAPPRPRRRTTSRRRRDAPRRHAQTRRRHGRRRRRDPRDAGLRLAARFRRRHAGNGVARRLSHAVPTARSSGRRPRPRRGGARRAPPGSAPAGTPSGPRAASRRPTRCGRGSPAATC